MPQANDAELTELYTSAPGLDVEDNEPNTGAPGGPPTNGFQLHLEAVAGNVIGNGGGNYRLEITCIDETLAAVGSHKSKILSATVYVANMGIYGDMNAAWDAWVDPANTPARATVEARLASPKYLVEIMTVAAI